jgi:hypothetical protein
MSAQDTGTSTASIGELINIFYQHFIELYGDEELASVATAAVINDLLADGGEELQSVA